MSYIFFFVEEARKDVEKQTFSHFFCLHPFFLLSFSRFFSLLHWVLFKCCAHLSFADLFKLFCALIDGEREECVCVAFANWPFAVSTSVVEVCWKHGLNTGRDRCGCKLHRKRLSLHWTWQSDHSKFIWPCQTASAWRTSEKELELRFSLLLSAICRCAPVPV